jgi:DUF1009 family protein
MTLALIAGLGGLPPVLAATLRAQGRAVIICEMHGFVSEVAGDFERIAFRFETLGTFLATLKTAGVTDVCMAGAMQRPKVDPFLIDAATLPLVPRLMAAMAKGDDGTLSEVVALFKEQGFAVVGAHHIAPDLRPRAGVPTKAAPPDLTAELVAAQTALVDMGHADQGQAMLLRCGAVIAVEDTRGTAAMLQDFYAPQASGDSASDPLVKGIDAAKRVWGTPTDQDVAATGAILFKAPKPNQNMLVDMPLIGPDTAMQAVEAGLAGIVIQHGGVMVLDLPQVIAILDAHAMFLWVKP